MKKSVLLVLASASLILAACGNKPTPSKSSPTDTSEEGTSVHTSEGGTSEEGSSEDVVYVESIGASTSLTVEEGNAVELQVEISPANAPQGFTVTSSDDSIAYYEAGYVMGLKAGTVTLTITSEGVDLTGEPLVTTTTVTVTKAAKVLTPISQLITAKTGTEFATHAYVVGMSSDTYDYTNNGKTIAEYKYVYIADGENFLQGFNIHADDLKDIKVGDLVEVEGKISQYGSKSEHWITPEFSSTAAFTKIEADENVAEPEFGAWDALNELGTITEADINRGYEIVDAIVTSISTSSKGHTTIHLMLGEETATLYLHADSKDNAVEGFSNIKPGWRISGTTFVGVNYDQDGFQFVGLNGATFTEGTLPDQDITALADVVKLEKGATFQSRAKVVGLPDKTEEVKGAKVWNSVFVADGATFYQLYQVPEAYLDGVKVGDYIEFKGTVNNYTNSDSNWTTYEATVAEKVEILESASGVTEPVYGAWDSEHALGTLGEADLNKGLAITGADITEVKGSNITLKIGSETIGVYLRANSYNLPIEKVVAGNKLSAKGFVGHNKGTPQFVHLEDISVEEVDHPVESVEVDAATAEIAIGGTHTIVASITPSVADQSVTFEVTSGSDYIEVSDKGVVTGKAAGVGVVTVKSVKDPTKTATVTVTVKNETQKEFTVTKTVQQLATDNSWGNGDVVNSFKLGEVTVTKTGGNGDSKYYTSGYNWRNYLDKTAPKNEATITFAASEGYSIKTLKVTYTWKNSHGTFDLESGTAAEINATSKACTATNTSAEGSEQLLITAFEVVYEVVE